MSRANTILALTTQHATRLGCIPTFREQTPSNLSSIFRMSFAVVQWGVLIAMHGRRRMAIDPRIPTTLSLIHI